MIQTDLKKIRSLADIFQQIPMLSNLTSVSETIYQIVCAESKTLNFQLSQLLVNLKHFNLFFTICDDHLVNDLAQLGIKFLQAYSNKNKSEQFCRFVECTIKFFFFFKSACRFFY